MQGASALTYYTLLSVVPVIALLIGIARGFLFEERLKNWLIERFFEQKQVIMQLFAFANQSLEETKGGVIAGIGIAILLWAAIKILLNLELVMNQIWEVKKGRSFARRFTDYFAMIFLAPILIFIATGLTGYLSATLSALRKGADLTSQFAWALMPFLSLFPMMVTSLLLTFLYIFMPNIRVRFVPALIAGFVTGFVYQVVQWLYLYFQIGVASYNAIYGTFAALPLFLIWLHLSWVIVLLGAKICFAVQNVDAYEFLDEDLYFSHHFRMVCALYITHFCISRFCQQLEAPSLTEISTTLSIPAPLTGRLLYHLTQARVLTEVRREDQEEAYCPACSVEKLTIRKVMSMMNEYGGSLPLETTKESMHLHHILETFSHTLDRSSKNILLRDIGLDF